MQKYLSLILLLCTAITLRAQSLKDTAHTVLDEVVVTGQYSPQSLRRSVYQLRVIPRERIALRAASGLQQVLSTELGIRFSNDATLGTTDIQLMGMSGRSVKILLDGVPMVDRGDTRESLSQIDVSTVERIEIVEGPMSVSYGSDALAGVINIITRKTSHNRLELRAALQEETAGGGYAFLQGEGNHIQRMNGSWRSGKWHTFGGIAHTDFGGWQGNKTGREREWKPKEQWMVNAGTGFYAGNWQLVYRTDILKEEIVSKGMMGATYKATDQRYITNRFMHQLQGEWKPTARLQINSMAAYTDYRRRTETTQVDLTTGQRVLTSGAGEQDVATFSSLAFRSTAQYTVSEALALQPGVDVNIDKAGGARISGTPSISDYGFFMSAEWKLGKYIQLRPGMRLIHNSVYDAPPVIPSINARISLGAGTDLRPAYAKGFRAPALRELYFSFFDASHSIKGNPALKAEESNSFSGSLSWLTWQHSYAKVETRITGFYNDFNNLIGYGADPNDPSVFMTVNIDRFKTTGATIENTIHLHSLQATIGASYIGRFNRLSQEPAWAGDNLPAFTWSAELNANITWSSEKLGLKTGIFYKFTGKRPAYQVTTSGSATTVSLVNTAGFHLADITADKKLNSYAGLQAGIKNLFNIGSVNNSAVATGGAHVSGGPVPVAYGRSFFVAIHLQLSR